MIPWDTLSFHINFLVPPCSFWIPFKIFVQLSASSKVGHSLSFLLTSVNPVRGLWNVNNWIKFKISEIESLEGTCVNLWAPRKEMKVFLIDSNAGLGIQRGLWYLVSLNEYPLEKNREAVGRENNTHSVIAGIITILLLSGSVSQWDMTDRGIYISADKELVAAALVLELQFSWAPPFPFSCPDDDFALFFPQILPNYLSLLVVSF